MTDAQARYSATLRKWANYARALAGGVPVDVDAAELARAVDFTCGDFAREDFAEYQMFRAALVNRPELLAEFDGLRARTRAAWNAVQTDGVDAARALRLANALDVEAEYVGRVGLSETGGGALEAVKDEIIKQGAKIDKQGAKIDRLCRTVRGEDTGRNGGRPRKPGAEKMILRVIQCAVDKLRPKRSHYADHVFRNWKGERPYISAHSLFTSARRYLANNGLPDLPTTAAAQADFVRAVNGNAVISQKLEAHKPR